MGTTDDNWMQECVKIFCRRVLQGRPLVCSFLVKQQAAEGHMQHGHFRVGTLQAGRSPPNVCLKSPVQDLSLGPAQLVIRNVNLINL
jgi:hypothetical protein